MYSDACLTGLAAVTPDATVTAQHYGRNIFTQETIALVVATLIAPERALLCCDNQAFVYAVRAGHGQAIPWDVSLALFLMLALKKVRNKGDTHRC